VLPDGEQGELVFTSLTKEAFTVIRYRTRDLTRLLPGVNRTMRRMEKITGRSDDMMIIRGVNVFPTQIEEILLEDSRLSPNYQIELTREERLDVMTLLIEPKESGLSGAVLEGSSARLSQQVKNRIGVSVQVQMQQPGGVERSMGKARRIVDKREKD
jgi:phenylacetate-CoA ligase